MISKRIDGLRPAGARPTRNAVGMNWVTFHTFRHTCASLLFEDGRNVKQVSEWLGHADSAFTLRRYVHLMDAGIGDADFLDDAVSGTLLASARRRAEVLLSSRDPGPRAARPLHCVA